MIFQTAAEQDGIIQAPHAEIVERSNNIAMDVIGQVLINASTKDLALPVKPNA